MLQRLLFKRHPERGQGLVEYALLLVLVAVVVLGILMLLGPVVRDVFTEVANALGNSGVIAKVEAVRPGGGNSNDLDITITVSDTANLTITDTQSGKSASTSCSSTCTVAISSVGPNSGSVTVTATEGGQMVAAYGAKSS